MSIELEGTTTKLQEFQTRLRIEKPTHAQIEVTWAAVLGDLDFTILDSDESSSQPKSAVILPDLATCPDCFTDIFNPANRHYRYPFINCTHCGPRFSVVKSLPSDRVNTTLQWFPMCLACQAEYDDPADRRFHAQPNACPICGPHLEFWNRSSEVIADRDDALIQAAAAVRAGQILELKGLGGFQLIVDARNDVAVKMLRDRKHRPDQPLAVMFPSIDLVRNYCQVNALAARPVDDSIVQIVNGQPSLLRRARGYAPMPISLGDVEITSDETILAVGGHLKNTVALYVNRQLFVSQYIGDLDCVPTCDRFQATIQELCSLYNTTPSIVVCDVHPDYYSTQFAQTLATTDAPQPRLISVQHHYAHVLSCLADNQWQPPVLGIAWDGTGYGLDGTIWGGEFLWLSAAAGFIRAAHLRTFPLPGGTQAIEEPRRCAVGLLYECLGEAAFDSARRTLRERLDLAPLLLETMLQRGLNTPRTSSTGRLFEVIASLSGLCQKSS